MKVFFRVDSSTQIGNGHIVRCLALARALGKRGARCAFICSAFPGAMLDMVRESGFQLHVLPVRPEGASVPTASAEAWAWDADQVASLLAGSGGDWLVVDKYDLDSRWEDRLRRHCHRLMVIDDLADRQHHCDLLLDQNLGRVAADYGSLVPAGCEALIGPAYALLRPEFARLRPKSLSRRSTPRLQRVLVSMGGVDRDNATGRVLEGIERAKLPGDCRITIAMGLHAPWLEAVRVRAAEMRWATDVQVDIQDMAGLMADCDLAIGAAGGTSWERCCLGLPALVAVLADNQRLGAFALAGKGAVRLLGGPERLDASIAAGLGLVAEDGMLQRMGEAAAEICDGMGAERVAERMERMAVAPGVRRGLIARRMEEADLSRVLAWRNHPEVRRHMYTAHEISIEEHRVWFRRCAGDERRHLLVVEEDGIPLGFVQFEEIEPGIAEWGFYAVPGAPPGTGRKLTATALDQAFGALGIEEVRGAVLDSNQRSLAFHLALGFTEESRAAPDAGRKVHRLALDVEKWRASLKEEALGHAQHHH